MTIQDILNAEYTSWVDTEAVTVTIFANSGGPGSGTNVSIATASQLNEHQARRVFGDFSHDANTKVWTIPDALLNPSANGNVLKNGDVIQDTNSVKWRIDKVSRVKLDTQWVCLSVKQL
ncbi:MAG TPA: hypothetical protein VFG04_03150 [Planctomycetaceae bacterium]|nr:hypothetical protein [Planctomycetaceae bacterium]